MIVAGRRTRAAATRLCVLALGEQHRRLAVVDGVARDHDDPLILAGQTRDLDGTVHDLAVVVREADVVERVDEHLDRDDAVVPVAGRPERCPT